MIKKYLDYIPQVGESSFIAETAVVSGNVTIGENCGIWYGTAIRSELEEVIIKDGVNVQDNAVIHVQIGRGTPTVLEKNVSIGHGAILHSAYIGEGSMVGMGAIVLNRARIGAYSLIAAGALVTEGMEVPERSLVVGSPAKVLRELTSTEIEELKLASSRYQRFAQNAKKEQESEQTQE